ncbi:MAG: DUF512 domain-containing protein [Cellulosilyticaceae bacterium]
MQKMKNGFKHHKIVNVVDESISDQLGIEPNDFLVSINNEKIQDVFDYRYLMMDEQIELTIQKSNGEIWDIEIEKDEDEDLGLIFETELMDELIRCHNKCQFCFIDQLPPNMRETVYFKDDDWRMSFLNGNYITMTNMSSDDVDRLIKYHLSPINISIHATNKDVRINLLHNKKAGEIVNQIKRLVDNGIEINGQIVLCKGINDGDVLDETISELSQFIPHILSLTVVPVGISKFRQKLMPLEGFDEKSAANVVQVIEKWQKYYLEKMDTRFVFAADEFYVTGKVKRPTYDEYEGFPVLDNGVGMLTKFEYELEQAISNIKYSDKDVKYSVVTGVITETFINECVNKLKIKWPNIKFQIFPIVNHFFGEDITVTGLVTGQDIIKTLKNESIGNVLLIPENMLKCEEEILLDDFSVEDLKRELDTPIEIMPIEGNLWVQKLEEIKEKY